MMMKMISFVTLALSVTMCEGLETNIVMGQQPSNTLLERYTPEQLQRANEAKIVFEQFLLLEESQQYERSYDLLSSNYKAGLKQSHGIVGRKQYKKMRGFRGLRWHSAKIIEWILANGSRAVVFNVEISFEQQVIGERIVHDRMVLLGVMLNENSRWVVDGLTGP